MSDKKASVIIPVWNGRRFLGDCLDAVLAQEGVDFEVVAVDNASTDDSFEFVAQNYPQVQLVGNEYNLGFAGACNVGIRAAQGEVLVLLNQDTVAHPGWLRALTYGLAEPGVGVVGCKILYPDGETVQHAGGRIDWPLGLAQHYGQHEQNAGQWDAPRSVDYVTGAAMAFRRDVLDRIGFLDEEFWPGYFEDVDFCFRACKASYEVWYIPEAVLVHVESASHTNQVTTWESYHRGRLRFLLKHMPPAQFLAQFAEAEALHQPDVIGVLGSRPLCRAYLETISRTASILRRYWQAEEMVIGEVIRTFQRLHSLAWAESWQRTEASVMAGSGVPALPDELAGEATSVLQLQEYEFQSDVAVIGPLIAWFRNFWYGIAAKWSIGYLTRQQEAINHFLAHREEVINQYHIQRQEAISRRYQRYVEALERRVAELADENALLAKEVASLNLRLRRDMADQ